MTNGDHEILNALSVTDLSRVCCADRSVIISLVEFGVLTPTGRSEADWMFDQTGIQRAVRACRLARDLALNTAGIALVLDLLEERSRLLGQIQTLSGREI
ncbi:chaperone modulator CbpM [Pseudaestuariivita atlantica]|uniref:chaperone modulator CbpM n=1 Tax=Pseudaestuariivita atlantica TaxID=1317121 RepID=UPI0009E2C9B1|nr:chaperone modulator CbpM [Pseudaestuariivita atlantica]